MREYILQIKIDGMWIETKPYGDAELLFEAEKKMHDAGIRARVQQITTEREVVTE